MFVNSDFSDLLRLFNANNVKYLVIGGYAVVQHAEPRFTKDLDLWVEASPANAKAVFHALADFGAPLAGMSEADFAEEGYFYQMGIARCALMFDERYGCDICRSVGKTSDC